MSDPQQPKEVRPHRATSKGRNDARAAALEKALRDNLRRRKIAATPEGGSSLHEKGKEKPKDGA